MPADVAVFSGSRSGPQFVRRNPRQKTTLLSDVPFDVNSLAGFKTTPCKKPGDFESRRPYVGNCCQCMPISKGDLQESPYQELGIRNILDTKQQLKLENVWSTFFSTTVYAWRRPLFGPYPDLSMAVLTNRRVVEAVQKAARELDTEKTTDKIAVVEKRAAKIMKKMKSSISTVFIKFTGWFLLKFLSIMHRGVLVHRGQMAVVKRAAEKGMPMIYLPLHRSHLDYILMTFILWNYDIRPPHVAAGDNMDIPFFSQLMRSLGGFFIRRRLDNGGGQKDHVYRAILTTYMLELLKKGESLEFFIEGGRSRTGRAVIPKGGLMSVVTEACTEGIIYDAYIVPVTFSYDKLLEGTFNQEQMGLPKMKETFSRACKAIFSVLMGDYGFVRINFAQPFSLREFLQSAERFPSEGLQRSKSLSNASTSGLNLSQQALSLKPSNGSPDGQDTSRAVVRALAQHTVYTSVHTQTPMSTHCLAFLFLTKFRQGGTVAALAEGMLWLRRELRARKVDVGFCGSDDNAVLYAQRLLGDEVVMQSVSDAGVVLTPCMEMPAIFTLSYNANALTASFVMESIIACTVVVEAELMPSLWCEDLQVSVLPTVVRDNLVTTATTLCHILQAEFVLVPPCKRLEDVLVEKVEDMLEREILLPMDIQYDANVSIQDRYSTNRLSRKFNFHDDEDDEEVEGRYIDFLPFQVDVNRPDIRDKVKFLHSVLAPVLESYLLTALFINQAITDHWLDMPEDDFMRKLGDFATERAKSKLVMHTESCGRVVLRNAVKAFQQLGILDTYQGANLTMLTTADDHSLTDNLHHYIRILSVARS